MLWLLLWNHLEVIEAIGANKVVVLELTPQ
jgi:hypothetical protein